MNNKKLNKIDRCYLNRQSIKKYLKEKNIDFTTEKIDGKKYIIFKRDDIILNNLKDMFGDMLEVKKMRLYYVTITID